MSRPVVFLVVASLVTFAAATAIADPGERGANGADDGKGGDGGSRKPGCLPGEAFENDEVRIWFQGLKGHLKVFDKRDNDTTLVYGFQTIGVDEVSGENESLAHIDLERAYPHDSGCDVVEAEEWVNVTYTVGFAVDGTTGHDVGDANITFAWHFNKSSNGAKFDLFVEDWPWQSSETELAFDFAVTSALTIESAENGLGFRDGSDSRGYIEWAPNATAYYADGHEETAIVDSETTVTGHHADVRLRFTNASAGYEYLEYDPFVGVGDYLILGNLLIGLGFLDDVAPEAAQPVVDLIRRVI